MTQSYSYVSVPFRGSCSEMIAWAERIRSDFFAFPSPFGVRVLKSGATPRGTLSQAWFPSPFGVRVLKSGGEAQRMERVRAWFPSPFGVRVLKLNVSRTNHIRPRPFPSPFGVRVLKFSDKMN